MTELAFSLVMLSAIEASQMTQKMWSRRSETLHIDHGEGEAPAEPSQICLAQRRKDTKSRKAASWCLRIFV